MNYFRTFLPIVQRTVARTPVSLVQRTSLKEGLSNSWSQRGIVSCVVQPSKTLFFSSVQSSIMANPASSTGQILAAPSFNIQQNRYYKTKRQLELRCSGCYYVKRRNRLFVECKLKPRHKQMQIVSKRALYKDDYSEGDWKRALYWHFEKRERFYWKGNNEYGRFNWLADRIGKDV